MTHDGEFGRRATAIENAALCLREGTVLRRFEDPDWQEYASKCWPELVALYDAAHKLKEHLPADDEAWYVDQVEEAIEALDRKAAE